jgi:glycosyltransferase involved in cell wall biosynthesis
MKILYFSDILSSHDQSILEGFAQGPHEVAVATFFHRKEDLPDFVRPFHVMHERLSTYPDGYLGSRIGWVRAMQYRRDEKRAIEILKGWLQDWNPDLVFASWTITAGYIAAKAGAKPLALYPWGSDVLYLPQKREWYRRRSVEALRGATMWVCNARHTGERARELSGADVRIEVLPCEVDAGVFDPGRADRSRFDRLWPGKKVVMSTRPLRDLYNPETIVRAMHHVDAALFLTSTGNLRESLEAMAPGDTHFAGMVPQEDLPGLLAACDVYVSASTTDSASSAVFEAMACERPVVASDIEANRACIQDGVTGRLFRTGDPGDLASKLSEVLRDPGDLGANGRAWMLQHADRRTNFPKLISALESLVRG